VVRVIISDRGEQLFFHLRVAKLICSLWFTADGDEEDGVGGADEVRRIVGQGAAADGVIG
jgi:hypothetical protein